MGVLLRKPPILFDSKKKRCISLIYIAHKMVLFKLIVYLCTLNNQVYIDSFSTMPCSTSYSGSFIAKIDLLRAFLFRTTVAKV